MDTQILVIIAVVIVALLGCLAIDFILKHREGKALVKRVLASPGAIDRAWLDLPGAVPRLNVKFTGAPLATALCLYKIEPLLSAFQAAGVVVRDLRFPERR